MTTNLNGARIEVIENALTGGIYQKKGWYFTIPSSADHVETISLPFNVDVLAVRIELRGAKLEDYISVLIGPDTISGTVLGGHGINSKVIQLGSGEGVNFDEGHIVKFGAASDEYWVTEVDIALDKITIWRKDSTDTGLVAALSGGEDVKRTKHLIDREYFSEIFPIITGDSKIGSTGVTKSQDVKILIHNSEAVEKKMIFNLALLYGEKAE